MGTTLIQIQPTIAMRQGRARVLRCVHCGVVMYVSDTGALSHLAPLAGCPRCGEQQAWSVVRLPYGPFVECDDALAAAEARIEVLERIANAAVEWREAGAATDSHTLEAECWELSAIRQLIDAVDDYPPYEAFRLATYGRPEDFPSKGLADQFAEDWQAALDGQQDGARLLGEEAGE